jgi:hypothetical protein
MAYDDKPSSVAYSYGGAQAQGAPPAAAGQVQYPTTTMSTQQQGGGAFYPSSQPPPPPPPTNTFAVGTPAYYVDPSQQYQQQQQQASMDSCIGPQLWLFVFGWLLAPFFFVGAMLPACVPLKPGERGLWIANLVMSIVSFTLAIVVATTVPIMKYGMHGNEVK